MQYKRSRRTCEYTLGHPTLRANPALLATVPWAFLSCDGSHGSVKQVDAFLALLKGIPQVPSTDPAQAVAQFYGLLREAVKSTVGWRIYPVELASLTAVAWWPPSRRSGLDPTSTTICSGLGVAFHPGLLTPYDGNRLTALGDQPLRTLGDLHFLDHGRIDPDRGTSWQRVQLPITLDAKTVRRAEAFGYET